MLGSFENTFLNLVPNVSAVQVVLICSRLSHVVSKLVQVVYIVRDCCKVFELFHVVFSCLRMCSLFWLFLAVSERSWLFKIEFSCLGCLFFISL